ncbi:MAG: HlyD family efflux transporter periplasmic adaptor subunit [Clostridia bacterium]|nr:HlyD family efflux transporter periplasmic adaptor subunit [Clostridia bacterium]
MKKRLFTCLAVMLCGVLLITGACADSITLSGTVIPAESIQVCAPIGGTVGAVLVEAGQKVQAKDLLYTMRTTKIYAEEDGTVTGVFGQPGGSADTVTNRYGAVLYLEGKNAFTVSASTDNAYATIETKFVHAGETVWLQCRSNADRKGKGIITKIDGNSYEIEVTEGNFIHKDSVEIYRDEAHTATLKIGRGTASRTTPTAVTPTGAIVQIAVKDGDEVKRGDLLLETLDDNFEGYVMSGTEITAGQAGVVGSISVQTGDSVQKDSVAAVIYPVDKMRVEATVPEEYSSQIQEGDSVTVELETDENRTFQGTVVLISSVAEEGAEEVCYRIVAEFTPDEAVRFGMSASITAGEEPEPETEADEVPAADEDAEPDETATEEGENASGEAETAEGEKKERPEKPEGFDPSNLPEGFDPSNLPERPENGEKPNN